MSILADLEEGITDCQNIAVSSSRRASTPQPGLQLLTVQLAKLPISLRPREVGSKGVSISIGTSIAGALAMLGKSRVQTCPAVVGEATTTARGIG